MKTKQNPIPELSKEIRSALCQHVKELDSGLSSHEVHNAWIKFSNTLELTEKSRSSLKSKERLVNFPSLFSRWVPALSLVAIVMLVVSFQTGGDSLKTILVEDKGQVVVGRELAKIEVLPSNYELPKPERFSEMVSYVEKYNESKANKELDSEFDRRISAELEQSLRTSFREDSQAVLNIDLNSGSLRADQNSEPHVAMVSNY